MAAPSLFLFGREGCQNEKKKKKRRGDERNRRERSKNLSNQFNERTRAINQLLFFRREEEGKGTEEGEVSERDTIKGRADAFYEPPMSFLTPPSPPFLSRFPPDAVHNAVN